MKRVVHRSIRPAEITEKENIDEIKGKMSSDMSMEKLMHSVFENDREKIDQGKFASEAINQGVSSFTPDMAFENLVNNYSVAEKLYGEKIIRAITGYDPSYVEKNIHIPEFRRELKKAINENIENLKQEGILNSQGSLSEEAFDLAAFTLYFEELEKLKPEGFSGERLHKENNIYGMKNDVKEFKKERYKDISVKGSVKTAIRRGHKELIREDLRSYTRESKGRCYVVYAIDASGSMKGKKIEQSKKAGIALAFRAIEEKDSVGLIVFSSEVKKEVRPTRDFVLLLKDISRIRASGETGIAETLKSAVMLFPEEDATKHLILITDAMPTKGKSPEKETIEAAHAAHANGITLSLIGVNLSEKGQKLAEKLVEIGKGRFYVIKEAEDIDVAVLEDYYSL